MTDCVFCKIVAGELPTKFVYEDDDIAVFPDIKPAAKTHLIAIPKIHFLDLADTPDEIVIKLKNKLVELASPMDDYRIVVNGAAAQQVKHLHFHLLGGVL